MLQRTTLGRSLAGLLFPPSCHACQSVAITGPDGFCPACQRALADNFSQHYCPRCATTVGPYAATDGRCSACRGRPSPVSGIVRLGSHTGALRNLLLSYKFGGWGELDRYFGDRMAAALGGAPWFPEVEAVVAVPTCWHRHVLGRPYIATELSRRIAGTADRPCMHLLRRVRGGPSQVGLSYARRVENIRGAFGLARGVKLHNAVICLVDDVTTTGATLAECAAVLKRAGALRVYAVVATKQEQRPGG